MIRFVISDTVFLPICPIKGFLSVYPDIYMCIALPFTSNLVGGDVKGVRHHSLGKKSRVD